MIIDYFDAYVNAGFKPIALSPFTKKPMETNWNQDWSVDRWRIYFENNGYNMGILLGDVIDVEADCETSNSFLNDILSDCPHIKFRSYRSTHHLFIGENKKFRFLKVNGIEFRGHGLHSVVPPSIHQNGYKYQFTSDNKFLLTHMPENLRKIYLDNLSFKKITNPFVASKDQVYKYNCKTVCKKCNKKCFINKKRLICEVKIFANLGSSWLCHKCRSIKITKTVRKMLK